MVSPARSTVVLVVAVQPEITQGAHDPGGSGGTALLPPNWRYITPEDFVRLPPEQQAAILAAQQAG